MKESITEISPQVDVRRGCCGAAGGVSPVCTADTRPNLPHGDQSYGRHGVTCLDNYIYCPYDVKYIDNEGQNVKYSLKVK